MAKDIKQIRRENLTILLGDFRAVRLSEISGVPAAYLSQIKSRHREMGDETARRLEEAASKEYGWMDQDNMKASIDGLLTDDPGKEGLGPRIKRLRKASGLTMEQLGELSGVTKGAISSLEKGLNGISATTLLSISRVFGVHPEEMLCGRSREGKEACGTHSGSIMPEGERLCERLKSARKVAGLTQEEVIALVGITQPAYSELETGKSASSSYLPQIAKALAVDAHWLATGNGDAETYDLFGLSPHFNDSEARFDLIIKALRGEFEALKMSESEQRLISAYRRLSSSKRRVVDELVQELEPGSG